MPLIVRDVRVSSTAQSFYRPQGRPIIGQHLVRVSSVPPPVARLSLAVLGAFLLFVVLFWRLGVPSFWDPDEAHYAQTTQEMVATGDWLAPVYKEEPLFHKTRFFP